MKQGTELRPLMIEVVRQAAQKRDLLVPQHLMVHQTQAGGESQLLIEEVGDLSRYDIGQVARRQLAKQLDIPLAYFDRMRKEQPQLLDENVNTWLQADHGAPSRLVRTLDGRVRAMLSNRYRRIENVDLVNAILPELNSLPGCQIVSCELTETRLYLKAVSSRVACEVKKGDVVQAGVVISNSEVGCGLVKVEPLVFRLVCLNGLILPDNGLRKLHVGAAHDAGDSARELFQEETLAASDAAFFLQVRDVVRGAISEANLKLYARRMRDTSEVQIEGDVNRAVEVLGNRFDLTALERSGVLRQLVMGGDMSGYGLLNAVTAHAKEIPDYDRATELEMAGGHMLHFTERQWGEISTAG